MKKYIFEIEQLKQGNMFPTNVLNEIENLPKEYKQEDKFTILEADDFDFRLYRYDENENKIKEKTKIQLYKEKLYILQPGEKFDEEKEEFSLQEKPSKYHIWNGEEWKFDIDVVKTLKRNELKKIREEKVYKNLIVNLDGNSYEFQMKEKDVHNFNGLKNTLDILKTLRITDPNDVEKLSSFHIPENILQKIQLFLKTRKVTWILVDNSTALFDFEQILLIQTLFYLRKEEIFLEFCKKTAQLQKAVSIKDIEKIKWD
ncbi:hypothetical protein C4N15_06815 [Fusobacterium necrophorum subsp. funduliforme]|uniref:hypothetical protein n=1 Tax=Fusobacterium necrophorum TaxID=859 RepID=UPI000D116D4A|nr:hypothetical protein [Fusobacterium necrophorum]AVQ21367.1 hypothetical protein C4N15_06815 [Fusobacterium necrophorum subsp. funduliforme]